MAQWSVEFSKKAEEDLAKIDRPVRRRIIQKLEWFAENLDSLFPAPLHAEWSDFFKVRVGDWRAVYEINQKEHKIIIEMVTKRFRREILDS